MKALIIKWLAGTRDYHTGVITLKMYDSNNPFIPILQKEFTKNNSEKLLEIMQGIAADKIPKYPIQKLTGCLPISAATDIPISDFSQSELYKSCKQEADLLFKAVMNDRAVLFSMVRNLQMLEDANRPDLIEQRRKLSIDVALGYIKVSKLYDRADFVRKNGKLPFSGSQVIETITADIPNHLVKQNLDNCRKNISKLKKREQTPERIELINKYTIIINELIERWQLLRV